MKKVLSSCIGMLLMLQGGVSAAQSHGVASGPAVATSTPVAAQTPVSQDAVLRRNLLELLNRVDQLQKEVRQLRGEIEVLNNETSSIKKRQRELYMDMDRRLRELELSGVRSSTAPAVTVAPKKTDAPKVATTTKPATRSAAKTVTPPTREEKTRYRRAFNLLKEGRYDQSINAFREFLKQYPQSSYADNAQYWLGEANYVSRKYKIAVDEFNKVIALYPESTKVADAMLKLGFTHYELQQWKESRRILQDVVQNYPKSSAARLANTRLKRMTREGR